MNKKLFFFISLIIFFFTIIFFILDTNFLYYLNFIFEKIKDLKQNNFDKFLIILILTNFLIFLTPIPTTPFIIFNGFVLGNYGFILSYLIVIICSVLIFQLAKNLKFILSFKFLDKVIEKVNRNKNTDLNFLIISASRFVFPYFMHNIFFSLILKRANIFVYSILIAEIPLIFLLNQFGRQIGEINDINNIDSVLKLENLITFIFFLLLIFVFKKSIIFVKQKLN